MFRMLVLQPQIPMLKLHLQSDVISRHGLREVGYDGTSPHRWNSAHRGPEICIHSWSTQSSMCIISQLPEL